MPVKISVSATKPLQFSADVVAVGVPKGAAGKPLLARLKKLVGASVAKQIRVAEFKAKKGQLCDVATTGRVKADRILLVGLGNIEDLQPSCIRRLAAKAARRVQASHGKSMGFVVPDQIAGAMRAAAEGVVLGTYRFETFKTDAHKSKSSLGRVALLVADKPTPEHKAAVALGQSVGGAVCIARDLINMPPNELYPEKLADYAKGMCKEHKTLSCTVLGAKALKDKGMLLLDAVGRGSTRGARFVHMKYTPPGSKGQKLKRLVFVGKGITFDTGGICLKPAKGMEEMKGDMGGAANIMAFMKAVAVTEPNAEIHGLIASAENMPGSNAYRPGDVFGSYLGKTVEIINTDAEGRLALADALAYGQELEPDFMLDNATLTGACVVALGTTVSGIFSNSDELAGKLKAASERAGESMWQLPLVESMRDKLKSDWADMKHMGDRWGGAITAALFLREFVGSVPWIHVDVAGPSMADKSYDIYTKGGTGAGVLSYLELVDALIAEG